MIKLTRLNHTPMILNADLVEHIETTPDTVVTLTNGQKFMVQETAEEIVEKVIDFRRAVTTSIVVRSGEQETRLSSYGR